MAEWQERKKTLVKDKILFLERLLRTKPDTKPVSEVLVQLRRYNAAPTGHESCTGVVYINPGRTRACHHFASLHLLTRWLPAR